MDKVKKVFKSRESSAERNLTSDNIIGGGVIQDILDAGIQMMKPTPPDPELPPPLPTVLIYQDEIPQQGVTEQVSRVIDPEFGIGPEGFKSKHSLNMVLAIQDYHEIHVHPRLEDLKNSFNVLNEKTHVNAQGIQTLKEGQTALHKAVDGLGITTTNQFDIIEQKLLAAHQESNDKLDVFCNRFLEMGQGSTAHPPAYTPVPAYTPTQIQVPTAPELYPKVEVIGAVDTEAPVQTTTTTTAPPCALPGKHPKYDEAKLRVLLKKGLISENVIKNNNTAYLDTFFKKKKSVRRYDPYDSEDDPFEEVDPTPLPNLSSKGDESEPLTKDNVVKEVLNAIYNNSHNHTLVDHQCTLADVDQINSYRLTTKLKELRCYTIANVADVGLTAYLTQFPYSEYERFTQKEYNVILSTFLGTELQKKCFVQGVIPRNLTTGQYLSEIHRIHNTGCDTEIMIEDKFVNYVALEDDIEVIWRELIHIIDKMPASVWSNDYKDKKLYYKLQKCLPDIVATAFVSLQRYDPVTHKDIPPTRMAMKNFINIHGRLINEHLPKKKSRIRINEVSDTSITTSPPSQIVYQQPPQLYPIQAIPPQNYIYPQANAYAPHTAIQAIAQGPYHVPPPVNTPNKGNGPPFGKTRCTTCKKLGHGELTCFHHPNVTTADENQRRFSKRCLLCSEEGHTALTCPTYPNEKAQFGRCFKCHQRGIFSFHKAEVCVGPKNFQATS
jgi:hypothetical protein